MPFATWQSFLGLAKEATRGTAQAPNVWLPITGPQPWDNINYLEDKGLRGSMVEIYNLVQGPIYQEYNFGGPFFLDSTPNILMGILGSDTVATTGALFYDVTTASNTTLTCPGANFSTALDQGKTITGTNIPGGTTVASVQSATSLTLSQAATGSSTTGNCTIARTGVNNHQLSLLNNTGSTGNQPPSYTIQDTNGATGRTRQVTALQFSEFMFKMNADGLAEYTAKSLGNPSTAVAIPTSTFTTVLPDPGWSAQLVIAGAGNVKLSMSELNFRRTVVPQFTVQNSQTPYRLFASQFLLDGKITFIYEDDTELNYYLNNTQPAASINVFAPASASNAGQTIAFRMNQCAFKVTKVLRGKEYVETEAEIMAMPNSTDAAAGGLSPTRVVVNNGQSTGF